MPPPSTSRIHAYGPVADLVRRYNWSETSLGPIDTWSETLLATINLVLAAAAPIQLLWGDDRIVLYNDALVPMLMDKHPWALGKPGATVWDETWAAVEAQIESVFTDGATFSYHNHPLSIRQNGVLQQTYWTFSYSPVYAPDKAIVGLLNLTQDTTSTFKAQQDLLQSEQRFRLLVDRASVGIAIGSMEGALTFLNPTMRELLGFSEAEVARGEVRWDNLTPPRFAEADERAIQQLYATGVAQPYEKAYYSKSGEPIPLLIGAAMIPSREEFGRDSDVAVFAVDLRPQKLAERAMLQTEKLAAVGKLASSISHEINNPLEAVINLLFIVRQDPKLSASSYDFLQTADRELARVAQVTSQTLRFHRQSTAARRIAPHVLVEETLELYGTRLRNMDVRVCRGFDSEACLTCYDGDIRQVLNNLIGNALDAMRNGGTLSVRTRSSTHHRSGKRGILITVADTGAGIPEATRAHIFDAFYTTKGIHGTGLGLWISGRIVGKHGGYLAVRSASEETLHGTVFHLWLPEDLAPSAGDAWKM